MNNKTERKFENTGRSMIEMLGTLAIIGVLSIAGIAGLSYARNKHLTNELLDGARLRALSVLEQNFEGKKPSLKEFNSSETAGGKFESVEEFINGGFGLKVSGVLDAVCENLIKSTENTDIILKKDTNGTEFTQCAETNEFLITFKYLLPENAEKGTEKEEAGCSLTAGDCLSGALKEDECACSPADEETPCTSWTTNECGKGKYCVFSPTGCDDDSKAGSGKCKSVDYIGEYTTATVQGRDYAMSNCDNCPDWWSAQSWCEAFGMKLISLDDVDCTNTDCSTNIWPDLKAALYKYGPWTTNMQDSCYAFRLTDAGGVVTIRRNSKSRDALCVKK